MGIKTPIIREGDDLVDIVVNSILDATRQGEKMIQPTPNVKGLVKVHDEYYYDINHKDVIGITESIVARAAGNYVTVDEISQNIRDQFGDKDTIVVINPIYSRNRFSMILKAITRAANKKVILFMPDADEVGNPSGVNPFTGVNMMDYYKELIENEGRKAVIHQCEYNMNDLSEFYEYFGVIYCGLHDYEQWKEDYGRKNFITLADICSDKCEYGLLGSNKATEERLKLFPSKWQAQQLVEDVQKKIAEKTGKVVEVMIYGDGCFKDPVGGIWEFADPVVSPAYTSGLNGKPNEIKIKAFADDKFRELNGEELTNAIKNEIRIKDLNLIGNMDSQGTTPRRYVDLLGSLMDLTSGSGDKGTPVVLVQNYFNNMSNDE